MEKLLEKPGTKLQLSKGERHGSTKLEHLGIVVGARRQQFLPPSGKLRNMQVKANRLLTKTKKSKGLARARDLRSFARKTLATGLAVQLERLRLRKISLEG